MLLSDVPTAVKTSRDWFLSITVMMKAWRTHLLRLSQASGRPVVFRQVLAFLFAATETWIKTVTQVTQKEVLHRRALLSHVSYVINPLCLLTDLLVGAFGADKAVLYRLVCGVISL